jgi:hypothetical protein
LELDETDAELLPGEDPSKARREDAEHWVRVYAELLAVVDGFLASQESPPGDVDRARLAQCRTRYAHRLEWWAARLNF